MLFGIGSTFMLLPILPLFGFAGGLLALLLIYRIAQSKSRLPIHSLLLAGVILNAILTAFIMFITSIMEPNRSAGLMAWLMVTHALAISLGCVAVYLACPCGPHAQGAAVKRAHAGRETLVHWA
jgi:iron complex transport system permease protein